MSIILLRNLLFFFSITFIFFCLLSILANLSLICCFLLIIVDKVEDIIPEVEEEDSPGLVGRHYTSSRIYESTPCTWPDIWTKAGGPTYSNPPDKEVDYRSRKALLSANVPNAESSMSIFLFFTTSPFSFIFNWWNGFLRLFRLFIFFCSTAAIRHK